VLVQTVVVGVGPWVNKIWNLLELPKAITVKANGKVRSDVPMWKFWCLEEGTLGVDPTMHRTNDGRFPPVVHVDTDAPLYSDRDGKLITDKIWGIYYKPDFSFGGVQGGASPYKVEQDPDQSRSIRMVRTPRISSSATTSFTCGARCWRIARSASKARSLSTNTKKNLAASAASRRTISRCSTSSARMSM
jgi:hypothetical protein